MEIICSFETTNRSIGSVIRSLWNVSRTKVYTKCLLLNIVTMKVRDLIEELQKLDQNNNIFLRNFMMCDEFEINQITKEEITVWNK